MLPIKTRDGFLRSGVRLSDGLYQRDQKSFSLRGNKFYDISAWKLDLDWRNVARTAGSGVVGDTVAVPSRANTTKGLAVPSPLTSQSINLSPRATNVLQNGHRNNHSSEICTITREIPQLIIHDSTPSHESNETRSEAKWKAASIFPSEQNNNKQLECQVTRSLWTRMKTSREAENNCESLHPICPTLGDSSKSDIATVLGWNIDTTNYFPWHLNPTS